MSYKETTSWMFGRLPMYQNQGKSAYKSDLTNTIKLDDFLGNPHSKFKSIHVAGTNGKGSTSHMIASVLQEAGYKVGLYTSPHLKDFRERIKINGNEIKKSYVIDFIKQNKTFFELNELSFFEMTVGMAFQYFADSKVDVVVIEVGLGGRLDSTNIITPQLSVITNIGLDHTEFLGTSLAEIASEKAGIIKLNVPVVIGETQRETTNVFLNKANEMNAAIYFADQQNLSICESDLKGIYQLKNLKTAHVAIKELIKQNYLINDNHIKTGLQNVVKNTGLKGRWHVLNEHPFTVCDTAHNTEGLSLVMKQILALNFEKLHIVFGVVKDKKLESIIPLLPVKAHYYFCKPNVLRGLNQVELQETCSQYTVMGEAYNSVEQAFHAAKLAASKNDVIFIGGSTFVVAEII